MEGKSVCDGKYGFAHQTIFLPVLLETLPSEIVLEGNTLLLKSSFHVSLVCIGEIIKKHNISIPDFEHSVINEFCNFTEAHDIKFLSYRDEFKFVARDDRRSAVVMCEVSNLDKFFERLNKKYGLKIEYPPTHVTLYTPKSKPGIFLTDTDDIQKLTKSIANPIGRSL